MAMIAQILSKLELTMVHMHVHQDDTTQLALPVHSTR
jgi:hypothetical protein